MHEERQPLRALLNMRPDRVTAHLCGASASNDGRSGSQALIFLSPLRNNSAERLDGYGFAVAWKG